VKTVSVVGVKLRGLVKERIETGGTSSNTVAAGGAVVEECVGSGNVLSKHGGGELHVVVPVHDQLGGSTIGNFERASHGGSNIIAAVSARVSDVVFSDNFGRYTTGSDGDGGGGECTIGPRVACVDADGARDSTAVVALLYVMLLAENVVTNYSAGNRSRSVVKSAGISLVELAFVRNGSERKGLTRG
jgi:hypothetical protein